jgi:hypothetical protein
MSLLHPTRRRLRRWTTDPEPGRVEKHLSGCERCSDRLGEPAESSTLGELLAAFVAPPRGMESQLVEELVMRERQSRDTLAFVVDLFGVWWDTGRVIFDDTVAAQETDDG